MVADDAEVIHHRLRAVVPCPDGDAVGVEDLGDVVRMDALDLEGDDPASPVGRRTEDTHVGELGKPAHRVLGQLVLVALDRVEADGAQVVDRDPEPVGLGDRRRPGLVLVGQVGPASSRRA